MPKYIIERGLPGAGKLSADELQRIARKSCRILKETGPQIQRLESCITNDKIYCTCTAPDAVTVHK